MGRDSAGKERYEFSLLVRAIAYIQVSGQREKRLEQTGRQSLERDINERPAFAGEKDRSSTIFMHKDVYVKIGKEHAPMMSVNNPHSA